MVPKGMHSSHGLLVLLVTLSVMVIFVQGYMGTRYGKRLPGSGISRIVGRSTGPRTIQSRSQARFYAGTRYAGKRSYWPTQGIDGESQQPPAPYDCVYVPYIGVRCALSLGASESEDNEDNYPSPPQQFARTSIIDSNGSSSD